MKNSLIIILTLFSLHGVGQTYPDTTKLSPLIKLIAADIQQLTVNDSILWANETKYYRQVRLLKERAKIYELLLLVEHSSPHVRINAFDLLLTSAYPHFVNLLAKHINDRDSLSYHAGGCIYTFTTVAEQMADLVSSNNSWIGKFPWDEAETKRLTEIIDKIFGRN